MSKRTERREAERLARRNAYQQTLNPSSESSTNPAAEQATESELGHQTAANQASISDDPFFDEANPTSPAQITLNKAIAHAYVAGRNAAGRNAALSTAQLTANQANAQLSTGPLTEAGKAISSKNALKHGLTGKTVLLPTDDPAEYNRLLAVYTQRLAPATDEERSLVQALLDSTWRLTRLKTLEAGIFIKGQIEFANRYEDQPADTRAQLIQVETYLKYERSIRNLNIQEARLHRRMEKDQAELTRLQTARKREERLAAEATPVTAAKPAAHAAPNPNGFEFSTTETNPLFSVGNPNDSQLKTHQAFGE